MAALAPTAGVPRLSRWKAILERRRAEDARWKAVSMSTDFDGLGDFADTPIAKALMEIKR